MRVDAHDFAALDAQAELFDRCRGKRLFLSGATGFFGKWLLESFVRANTRFQLGARLTALSRDPNVFLSRYPWFASERSLSFIHGEVRNFTFPEGSFDFILHAAAVASPTVERDDPGQMYAVIADGTRHMLAFAARARASRFLLTSSGAVYGVQPATLANMPETYAGTPVTAYGSGKLHAEEMCVEAGARDGFMALVPRCFTFVGPHLNLDSHFAVGNFIKACLEDRPIIIQGDGTPLRSYLYASELVEWLWAILLKGEHARPYNVGSGEAVSILDLARLVRECAGTRNEIVVQGKRTEGVLPARYVPSVDRAREELALCQHQSLADSLCRTITWNRHSRARCSGYDSTPNS